MTAIDDDHHWMGLALEQARQAAAVGEVPVGAVLVRDGQLLASGYNRPIDSRDPSAHAEIVVLRAAAQSVDNYRLSGSTLYVTVEPCAMCAGALIHARVATLVYGAPEARAGVVDSHIGLLAQDFFNHKVQWRAGVRAEECAELMRGFFASRRR